MLNCRRANSTPDCSVFGNFRPTGVLVRLAMGGFLSVALIATAGILCGAEPLVDEALRIQILRALFPETAISLAPGRSIDYTWTTQTRAPLSFPDALASENVYNVAGPPSDDLEHCAAQDMQIGR